MLARIKSLLAQTFTEWSEDGVPRLGAALAYYSIFSLGPLLIIAIAVASLFFDGGAAQQQVMEQVRSLVGEEGAKAVETMMAGASTGNQTLVASIVGIGLLLFGALSVVVQLKDAMNVIWDVEKSPASGVWGYVRTYAISLAGVLGLGFLLAVSLLISALISSFGSMLGSGLGEPVMHVINFAFDFLVLTLLFALMFKYLPDLEIRWSDVWIGAALTAGLFTLGKFLIALYLSGQGLESAYGAASSIVLLLIWIYYSAQIVFLGAEFSQVYARRYGSHSALATQSAEAARAHRRDGATAGQISFAIAGGMVLGALLAGRGEAAPEDGPGARRH